MSESSVNKLDAHTARSWTPGATERGLQKVRQNSALAIAQRKVGLPADKHMTPRQAFFAATKYLQKTGAHMLLFQILSNNFSMTPSCLTQHWVRLRTEQHSAEL